MNETPARISLWDEPGQYEIRLQGNLDSRWTAWFDGLSFTHDGDTTTIRGPVVDQAALHGLLQKVRDIGLPLVSVVRVHTDNSSTHQGA
jgi:hypothetical protein